VVEDIFENEKLEKVRPGLRSEQRLFKLKKEIAAAHVSDFESIERDPYAREAPQKEPFLGPATP